MTRAAIYARVSTRDQEAAGQLAELRRYAQARGWQLEREYIDTESGCRDDRPRFLEMLEAARRREWDVLLFWALDRLTRQGALRALEILRALDSYGVRWVSYSEQYLDSTGVFREAIVSILAVLAKQERIRISERTRAGIERARKEGKEIGRPRRVIDLQTARERLEAGASLRSTARQLGVAPSTLARRLRSARAE